MSWADWASRCDQYAAVGPPQRKHTLGNSYRLCGAGRSPPATTGRKLKHNSTIDALSARWSSAGRAGWDACVCRPAYNPPRLPESLPVVCGVPAGWFASAALLGGFSKQAQGGNAGAAAAAAAKTWALGVPLGIVIRSISR